MTLGTDAITSHIETLHVNRELIATTYIQGGIVIDDGNQRRIRQLQQARALVAVPHMPDNFKVSPQLNRHLDEISQKKRAYAAGANFGDLINRLPHLLQDYLDAKREFREDDAENYASDFDSACFEISYMVGNELLGLRTITENQFGNVKTLGEKLRQNEFYLSRAERIGHALTQMDNHVLLEQLESSLQFSPLRDIYTNHVLRSLNAWRATHLEITAILKNFLYRLRDIGRAARRLRAFAQYLHANPDYMPPDEGLVQPLPIWASRYEGIALKAHLDFSDADTQETLIDVARTLPTELRAVNNSREAGRRIRNGGPKQVVLETKPAMLALQHYIKEVSVTGLRVSAHEWIVRQPEFFHLDPRAWLIYVLHIIGVPKHAQSESVQDIRFEIVEDPPTYCHSGNRTITDLIAWKPN